MSKLESLEKNPKKRACIICEIEKSLDDAFTIKPESLSFRFEEETKTLVVSVEAEIKDLS